MKPKSSDSKWGRVVRSSGRESGILPDNPAPSRAFVRSGDRAGPVDRKSISRSGHLRPGDRVSNQEDLLACMQDFCGFLAGLTDLPSELLQAPMAKGKWSIQEVVAHIMVYDETFLQTVVLALADRRKPLFPDPADNQSFNDSAAAVGRKLTKERLIERAILARTELVDHLRRLPSEVLQTKLEGSAVADLAELLMDDFVYHDRIHIKQMKEYLNREFSDSTLPDGNTTL